MRFFKWAVTGPLVAVLSLVQFVLGATDVDLLFVRQVEFILTTTQTSASNIKQ